MLAALNKLGVKVFVATALVVVVALGGALFLTKRKADAAADQSIHRALTATQSNIQAVLDSRYNELAKEFGIIARQSPYVSSIQASLQTGDRSNLLDRAEEFRIQTGAAWVLITDRAGVLRVSTIDHTLQGDSLGEGALVGLALEGDVTNGFWLEPGADGRDAGFQAIGVPVRPGGNGPVVAVMVAALPIDSTFAAELKQRTSSEVVFYELAEARANVGALRVSWRLGGGAETDADQCGGGDSLCPHTITSSSGGIRGVSAVAACARTRPARKTFTIRCVAGTFHRVRKAS